MPQNLLNKKKKIVVLATGGTIAGVGKSGADIGYQSGVLTAESLIAGIPQIKKCANIQVEQICNINSDDIDHRIWFKLAQAIDAHAAQKNIHGIVVTHGTDTLEETALFLSLTLKTKKPVILTGSMKPATATNPDGPKNLCQAIKVACGKISGNNVRVAFAGKLHDGALVQKTHANKLDPFEAVSSAKQEYSLPKFNLQGIKNLPKVAVLYFHAEADVQLLKYAAKHSKGLVIAGAGAGEFSKIWAAELNKVKEPVVISTRINKGNIIPQQLLVANTIASYGLPPAKAALLLRLALTKTSQKKELEKLFLKFKQG